MFKSLTTANFIHYLPEDVSFPTDNKGIPVGDGCLLCRETAAAAWPDRTWEQTSDLYNSGETGALVFRAGFDASRARLQVLKDLDGNLPPIAPMSTVSHSCQQGFEVYFEVGLVTESEFQRLVGVAAKDFCVANLRPVVCNLHCRLYIVRTIYAFQFNEKESETIT